MRLRLGLHPNNLSLRVLSRTQFLEERLAGRNVEVAWVRFDEGPRTVDYIGAALVDFGGTGATPPITGQAKGVQLVYAATSEGRPVGGIVAPADGPIQRIADLRGKRVGLAVGSWLQQLLITALARNGVDWSDIVPLDLPDAQAKEALRTGGIDAWATGNNTHDTALRFIARTADVISNPSVFFAGRRFAEEHRDILDLVVRALDDADAWTAQNPGQAGRVLAADTGFGGDAVDWEPILRARPWGLHSVSDEFLAEQQTTADLFYAAGLLPRRVDVREAVLSGPVAVTQAAV